MFAVDLGWRWFFVTVEAISADIGNAHLGEEQWRNHPSIPGNARSKPPPTTRKK
jgi:hypothetical protein